MNIFLTTSIGYATRGASDEPSSSGFQISRVPLAVRWDTVYAIGGIEDPALCYDNEAVTDPISVLHTAHGSFHIVCPHIEAVRLWQEWQATQSAFSAFKSN